MQKISSLLDIPAVKDYLSRVGAEPRSLKTAVVKEHLGKYWKDVAVIRFGPAGAVDCDSLQYGPTEGEQAAITAAWPAYEFPKLKRLSRLKNKPPMMKDAAPEHVFEFRDVTGQEIIMVQVRIEPKDGDKNYVPWTYWDDNRWRCAEPDGELPLWGMEQLQEHKTVFIHEGAKAAAHCRWLAEGKTAEARKARDRHPWGQELMGAAHVGWIGGALSPRRTDWSVLSRAGIERAYIVADNDEPGKRAISSISQQLTMTTLSIEFSGRFKHAFDLADPFPDEMFGQVGDEVFYKGPTMRDLTQPATWATTTVPNPAGTGRPISVLRDSFSRLWAYVEEADAFVCTEMPEILRTESVFNKMVAPFSGVQETSKLLTKNYKGRSARVCYRPDTPAKLVDHKGTNAINLHVPSNVKRHPGDPAPWLEFLAYMFVNDEERVQVERWCATLIARPEVRMGYGLLLISETQGVGKTTLGSVVLAPLVGYNNVGYPGENDITSAFNDWVAHKRLAIVNEIYSGSSWKAYHALKGVITDHEVTVNQKYMRQYVIDNWCHVLACSNSMRALKMEMDDRRWFYPELTETPWPGHKFTEFREWVVSGGLQIIKDWAHTYGDYVRVSDRAPMTGRKREMIEGSRSEAQAAAASLSELMMDIEEPKAVMMKDVVGWVRDSVQGRVFDSDYELRRSMTEHGCKIWKERIKVGGWVQYAILNDAAFRAAKNSDNAKGTIRGFVVKPQELMEAEL